MTFNITTDEPLAPTKTATYMIIKDAIGNVIGLIFDPTIDAFDVEIMLGVRVETVFYRPEDPVSDIISRIRGM